MGRTPGQLSACPPDRYLRRIPAGILRLTDGQKQDVGLSLDPSFVKSYFSGQRSLPKTVPVSTIRGIATSKRPTHSARLLLPLSPGEKLIALKATVLRMEICKKEIASEKRQLSDLSHCHRRPSYCQKAARAPLDQWWCVFNVNILMRH